MEQLDVANFNKTEEFTKEIEPVMQELLKICNRNRVPMFCCVAVSSDGEKTEYKSIALNPAQYGKKLKENKFSDFTNIMNGFETYYKAGGSAADELEELLSLMNEGATRVKSENDSNDV